MPYDLDHLWSGDIELTGAGGFNKVTGTTRGEQRVLRRLLTNPGDYIWHPEYGAGLPRYVGSNSPLLEIEALIYSQMELEPGVAQNPRPVVKLRPILNGLFVSIQYVDQNTGTVAGVSFELTP